MPSAESPAHAADAESKSAPSKGFSISLSSKAKPAKSFTKPVNSKKRPHSSLAGDDSDHEDEVQQPQIVSAFDHSAGGAIGISRGEQKKEPLVILGQKNRDWRAESYRRKGKNLLPAEARSAEVVQDGEITERNEVSTEFGLSFVKRDAKDADGDVGMTEPRSAQHDRSSDTKEPRNADQEALEALIGDGSKKSTLVIPASATNEDEDAWRVPVNEDDAFRSDVASRPDVASLDDYEAQPVEGFGAGLLRGMGWKDGGPIGKGKGQVTKPRDVARRPALLGIGAKEIPGSIEELGAWGKATKGKRKVDKTYNPVLLQNSVTGEKLTEEELEAKKEAQKKEERDWRERRDRNLAKDDEKKSQRRIDDGQKSHRRDDARRDGSRSAERSRHGSSKRDRSRPTERSRHSTSHASSRHSSSRRDRSRSRDRKSSRRRDYDEGDDHDRKDKDRRQRDWHDRHDDYDDDDRKDRDRRRNDKYDDDEYRRSSKSSNRKRDGSEDTPRLQHKSEVS